MERRIVENRSLSVKRSRYEVIQTSNRILIFFQAAREIANTLARAPNVTYLPGGKDQNLLLGIGTR